MPEDQLTNAESHDWETDLLERIVATVVGVKEKNGRCSIALTGGRSAQQLYLAASASSNFMMNMQDVDFYFGDERCVPPDHVDSNYRLVMSTLFSCGLPRGANIYRIKAEDANLERAADTYASQLPSVIDVLLLSVGLDGHIASLFPLSEAVEESRRRVVPVLGLTTPFSRLTITAPVIRSAKKIFVMALGPGKRAIYKKALRQPLNTVQLPARLVLDREWVF